MGKMDYTKTENLLTEALLKMSIEELLQLADQASSFKNPREETSLPSIQARTLILSSMEHDLAQLLQVPGPHLEELDTTTKELKRWRKAANTLTHDEWDRLKQLRLRLLTYKKELGDKIPHLSDEELVQKERKKHINKRFNTRDKWLPLH